MFSKTLVLLLSLASAVTPYPSVKRDTDDEMNIYAYGSGISGLTVFEGSDGKAYITSGSATNTTLNELTWQTPNADAPWNVTITAKDTATSSRAHFYIVTTSDAFEDCGFHTSNQTVPTGATVTGFQKFGSQIIWSDGTKYISQFWAEDTGTDGLYKLKWNVKGTKQTNSVSVTLKTTAPSTAT